MKIVEAEVDGSRRKEREDMRHSQSSTPVHIHRAGTVAVGMHDVVVGSALLVVVRMGGGSVAEGGTQARDGTWLVGERRRGKRRDDVVVRCDECVTVMS